jgi:UDP:flavonoid glycosyltransferase YjiC (YdhE family)
MKILIHMLPELGHLNPTFPLARMLAERGHEVCYTAVLDLAPLIEARGFACVPIHADILPRGALTAMEAIPLDEERGRAWGRVRDRIHSEYFDGRGIETLLREAAPQLVLADVVALSPLQFAAHALGIPCVQLSTSLSQRFGAGPPLISPLQEDLSPPMMQVARWSSCCVRSFGPVPHTGIMTALLDGYCARYAYPPREISFESVFWPALTRFPEAVLCEAALDAGGSPPGSHHLAVPVDLARDETVPEDLAAFADGTAPLIYASLGSQPERYPYGRKFIREFFGAMREAPHWRAVLSVGRLADRALRDSAPPNVLMVRHCPQIWLLRRAALFVTHAGLGGIREAIELEVPMVAVPQQHDQPGNAARIVRHGVGTSIPADAVSACGLRRAIQDVLQRRGYFRDNLRALAQACRAERSSSRAMETLEAAAGAPCATPRRPAPPPESCARSPQGWIFCSGVAGFLSLRSGVARTGAQVGTGGFVMAEQASAALAIAGGSLLARVELGGDARRDGRYTTGGELRCLWLLQADELLFEYAEWCAGQSTAACRSADACSSEAFDEMLRAQRVLRGRGASYDERLAHAARTFAASAQLWHEGFAAAGAACDLTATEAAFGAQSLALHALARADAGTAAGTVPGMREYTRSFRAHLTRFNAELESRIARRATQVGIVWEAA